MSSLRDVVMENYFQFGLDDLESISREFPVWEAYHILGMKRQLGLMRRFHLFRNMWRKDVCGESALCTMEETLVKRSVDIQFLYLTLREDYNNDPVTFDEKWDSLSGNIGMFLHEAGESFMIEMIEPYEILSDILLLETSSHSPLEMEELLDLHHSLLHVLPEFLIEDHIGRFLLPVDAEKAIGFLMNLILFAAFQGLELRQMRHLLIHVQGSVLYLLCTIVQPEITHERRFHVNEFMRRIEPLESHVCGIYLGVLQEALELSQSRLTSINPTPLPESHTYMLVDFVDSLIFLLFKLLFHGSTHWFIFDHQIRKLYEGLKLLKTTLREHHQTMHHVIGPLICEAGIIIFYLFLGKEVEVGLIENLKPLFSDIDEKFKFIINAAPEETLRHYSLASFCFPHTNLPGFIDSVLGKMKSTNPLEVADSASASETDKYRALHDDLAFLRSFLISVSWKHDQNERLKALLDRIATVAYEIEFVLDSLLVEGDLQSFDVMLNIIIEEIKLIKLESWESSHRKRKIIEVQDITKTHSKVPMIRKLLEFNELVVGMDDEAQKIIDQLTRGTRQLDIVSIVGMAGLGKTTLAKRVYRHVSIVHHFYVRSWCTISQAYSKSSLLLEILKGLDGQSTDKYSELNEHDLARKLYQSLKGKSYLIILDDVWDVKAWSELQHSFPDDNKGSRILLTSRHENVALGIKPHSQPHCLRSLTEDESWELFQMKICVTQGCPSELLARGKSIAKRCKGLPMMILVIAGSLSTMEPSTWEEVEESLNKGIDQCKDIIELSYRHLPDHLKPCFLYFAAYPEDQKLLVREILWLWIAEGFVEKTKSECIEDVAEGYMMELIQRNLVMVAGKNSGGRLKFCILHDLLHEFGWRKRNEEQFMHHLNGHELCIPAKPNMSYRLCVYSRLGEDIVESRLHCFRLRTLFIESDFNKNAPEESWHGILYKFCQSRLLRILNLTSICKFSNFPGVILLLGGLSYLALSGKGQWEIPSTIEHLASLETFIVEGDVTLLLPNTLWNLKMLRHLYTSPWLQQAQYGWKLPMENPKHLSSLENLQILSKVTFSCYQTLKEVIILCPNIRKLKGHLSNTKNTDDFKIAEDLKIIALDFLRELESLWLSAMECERFHFQFPQNLKKLTLSFFCLPWSQIATISRLPNLEVLKLIRRAFKGEDWEMEEEEGTFPKLRYLKLGKLDLARWTGSDDCFPCLEKLVLEECNKLVELPFSCLANSFTLQIIEVTLCKHVVDSIKQIQETQMDSGNVDLKILTRSSFWEPFSEMKSSDELDDTLSEENIDQD
ncbi:OLC1v1038182C3 [Oldenlandia corymbosa var. corymbosa]|uniref:OLC1v1038182C3 n=2 Tax=Oldenlandia corymbosa var. corymbosa TaxID=529605 RepID=A0AAV1CZC5_OLDCO|nr:OLC1v1038182C3 [Oldenlandia corymbosa var. corymbosa]